MTSPNKVRMNGDKLINPTCETEKLYGGATKMTPLTTEKTCHHVRNHSRVYQDCLVWGSRTYHNPCQGGTVHQEAPEYRRVKE